jgi:hypothetical protein
VLDIKLRYDIASLNAVCDTVRSLIDLDSSERTKTEEHFAIKLQNVLYIYVS